MFDREKFFRPLRALLIVLAVILLIDLGYYGYMKIFGGGTAGSSSSAVSISETVENILPIFGGNRKTENGPAAGTFKKNEKQEAPGIIIGGYPVIEATAGETVIKNVNLSNDAGNKDWYYVSYELRLPDSSGAGYETLFKTDLIEPGKTISDVTLSRALEAGEYGCTLHVQPYYISTLKETNNADMSTKLIVR